MAFFNPNLHKKIAKIINSILIGQNVSNNEKQLSILRKLSEYPVIVCNYLSEICEIPISKSEKDLQNKKMFVMIEIRKNATVLQNQQCWWQLANIYYSENQTLARYIRQLVIESLNQSNSHPNYIQIFLSPNPQNMGTVGLIRYFLITYQLFKTYCNSQNHLNPQIFQTIIKHFQNIILLQIDSQFISHFFLVLFHLLIDLYSFSQLQTNKNQWVLALNNLIDSSPKKDYLKKFLTRFLKYKIQKKNQQMIRFYCDSINHIQLLESLKLCLKQIDYIRELDDKIERKIYVDTMQIINSFLKGIMIELQKGKVVKKQNEWQREEGQLLRDVMVIYLENIEKQKIDDIKQIISQEQQIQERKIILDNVKYEILKVSLSYYSNLDLRGFFLGNQQFEIAIMKFWIHVPSILQENNQIICQNVLESHLTYLTQALEVQDDAYLFSKQKYHIIQTLLNFITKFRKQFSQQLVLKICYTLDLLAFKCDSISSQCFLILQLLSEEFLLIENYQTVQFIEKSLHRINQNQWLQLHHSYFHIINLVMNINPQCIFNKSFLFSSKKQLSHLENQILIMIKKMIEILKKQFNYEAMHKLNSFLQFLILNQGLNICKCLRYDQLFFMVKTNYNYQIFTDPAANIYVCFCKSFATQIQFIQSMNLYDFWEKCQSQKLNFFVKIYLTIIDSQPKFLTSSEQQHKLCQLRKNLWHRLVTQNDKQEREKIAQVFKNQKKHLSELQFQYQKIQCLTNNYTNLKLKNQELIKYGNQKNIKYKAQKMELQ